MTNFAYLEQKKLKEIASQYEKVGYHVVIDPSNMPSFLKNYQVDLVALSDEDNILVEIVSQESMRNREKLERLAKLIEGRKNWRFELVVTNPKDQNQSKQDISVQEIINRLIESQTLINSKQYQAALLIAWSATEAIMRRLAQKNDIKKGINTPIKLTKNLYSLGVIGKSDYDVLILAAKTRNQLAHGYSIEETRETLLNTVNKLIDVTNILIAKLDTSQDNESEDYSVDNLVEWFLDNYEDPANHVPYETREGGYQYVFGGPYDPWEELADKFDFVDEDTIESAAKRIYNHGILWVKKGQY